MTRMARSGAFWMSLALLSFLPATSAFSQPTPAQAEAFRRLKQAQHTRALEELLELRREQNERSRERQRKTASDRRDERRRERAAPLSLQGRGGANEERHASKQERIEARKQARRASLRGVRQQNAPRGKPDDRRAPGGSPRGAKALKASSVLSFATNVNVSDPNLDNPSGADTQAEPSIAALGNNVLAAWNDGSENAPSFIGYATSTDNGVSFVDRDSPPEPANPGGLWTSDPVLTVNEKSGDFYLCALVDPNVAAGVEHGVGVLRGTFSGSNFTWTRLPVVRSFDEQLAFIDKPWIAVDSLSGNVYLSYTLYTTSGNTIQFQRSTDRGATWSVPLTLSNTAVSGAPFQGSRPVVGPAGEVYVTWKEIGPSTGTGADFFRIRKSTDRGVTFATERTAASFFDNWGTGAPGFNREQGIGLPSIAVDRTTGPRRGRVYVTWNESVNFYDSVPDAVPLVQENEPNGSPGNATPFTPGDALHGDYTAPGEFDYYRFAATQGSTYIFWCNQNSNRYTMRVFCSDGVTRLGFSGDRVNLPPLDGLIVWTCPRNDSYYLRIAEFDSVGSGNYTVLTGLDTPGGPGQRGRDQRDVFVASSSDGLTWGTPVLINANQDPLFDDWLPEVAVAGDGAVYVTWYDWSDSPLSTCGGQSQLYLARSDDGGGTWQQLGPVTSQGTAWTSVNAFTIPNQGDYTSLFANNVGVYPCWADGRIGTPDVWAAPFLANGLLISIESVAADTQHVAITWRAQGPAPPTANVYRAIGTGTYLLQQSGVPFDGSGRLTYDDQDVIPGQQHRYRLGVNVGGSEIFMGDRTVNVPGSTPLAFGFLGVSPNPTPRNLVVSLTLPNDQPAKLTLFDASGRMLREVTFQGTGPQQFDFWPGFQPEPGLYFLRLSHGGQEVVRRVSIIP